MSMYFSWTDICFLILLLIAFLFILKGLTKPHVRMAFGTLFRKPVAASAGLVLLFFLLISVLDSLHFQTANMRKDESISILDYLLAPMGENDEQTFSAPLALTLYNKVTVLQNGEKAQVYLRLNHVDGSLKTEGDVNHLAWSILWKSLGIGLIVTVILFLLIRPFKTGWRTGTVFLSVLVTFFSLLTVSIFCYWLSRYVHVLGTGKIGQDIFYFALKSIRTGIIIGLLTTLFMLPVALFFGIAAGYFGGVIDDAIQYCYTTLSSIPGILLITASVLSLQTWITNHPEQFPTLNDAADVRLLVLCIILGVTSWTSLCRVLRAETLKLREVDFVIAAKAMGSSSLFIIRKHLLPNLMHIVLITLVLDFSFLVMAEAVLSYVGVGVSPQTISWGNMINSARLELAREPLVWWPMFSALIFMFALVMASNLFADAVRDAFDPRH